MTRWLMLPMLLLGGQALAADAPSGLKPGPGREVVEASCGACHTPDYIRMNSTFLTARCMEGRGDEDAHRLWRTDRR